MELKRRGILVHPEDLTERWIDRMAEAGLNDLGLHPVGGKNAAETMEEAVRTFNLPKMKKLRSYARSKGITVEYEGHAMSWLIPRSLFSSVPEWFRMDGNGKRTPDYNFCPSNPEAMEYLKERSALLARLLATGSDRYYFWADDVRDGACRCEKCRSLSTSDQQLLMVNAMMQGIKRFKPEAKLCYLAYFDTVEVPANVLPEKGVFLEFAPFRRNLHRPINDDSCEENKNEIRSLPQLLEFFGKREARVLEYWTDNSLMSNWTKPPKQFTLDGEVMKQDVTYYKSLGFEDITAFGCYLGEDYDALYGEADLRPYGENLK